MSPSVPDHDSFTGQWQTRIVPREMPQVGLVLTGGGARSAYQVGVLKGVAELLPRGGACRAVASAIAAGGGGVWRGVGAEDRAVVVGLSRAPGVQGRFGQHAE